MNVCRYRRGYDGSNELTWRGWSYMKAELLEVTHSGLVVATSVVATYHGDGGRTLSQTPVRADNVLKCGHIPWSWIEHIEPKGDDFHNCAIVFVRYRAPGREPFDYSTFREAAAVPFGPNGRDYYRPLPDLGTYRRGNIRSWIEFTREMYALRASKTDR